MKQTKLIVGMFFIISYYGLLLNAQTTWVNGFAEKIAGENLAYHSCHPEANLSLLIRCLNNNDYIEWKTDTVSSNYKGESVTFAWIAGFSTGTSTSNHKFSLFVNENLLFEFITSPGQEKKDWQLTSGNGSKLDFKFGKLDAVNDFFGYMTLTIPYELLNGQNYARIKIKGDGTNSKDWYMTMQYPLLPKTRITPEKVVTKDSSGNLLQRVKVSIDHFSSPKSVAIVSENNNISSELKLGMNDFWLNITAPKTPKETNINITIDGRTKSYTTKINPAREITFYLIPHAHVDIGYTGLQTEIEKKHWDNFEKAIEYSKKSAALGNDALFKWNIEVLWAVKSYLENFPEKKKYFFDAVKNGWIGIDAMYANVMTALCRPEELYRLVDYSNDLEKEIGIKIESAMISDVPGYTWGIVQAFADNGIKYFSVGPNPFDRIGNTLQEWGDKPFYWQSPSGKNKILIWLAGKGYAWFHGWRLTRDDFSPITEYLDELDEKNYPYDMVHVRYNIGGDNGFPDSSLSNFVKQWNDTHVTPKFKIAANVEMFKDFEKKYAGVIPTFSGDFSPYWEDGAGSTAKESAMNRNTAELLTQLEILYTHFNKDNYPKTEFDEAWKYVLLFSEHTWGAWNSISDPEIKFVTDQWEIKKSYAIKADSLAQKLLQSLSKVDNTNKALDHFYVCNSSSWQRSGIIRIPSSVKLSGGSLIDENGNLVAAQRLKNGDLVFTAKNIPPFGIKKYKVIKGGTDGGKISPLDNFTLSNSYYTLSIDENTASIKFLGRRGNNFNYVDTGNGFLLNQFIHTGKNAEKPSTAANAQIINFENGPVLKSINIKSTANGTNSISQEIILFNDLDKIEIVNTIDKTKDYSKESIRFAFPVNISNPTSRVDLAWSVIRPELDQLPGSNKNYFTEQRWVDVSNNQTGLTLAMLEAPFIEFGGMTAEAWMSSPDKEWSRHTSSSSQLYSWAMNNSWHTNFKASQEGVNSFKYFLILHDKFNYFDAYKFGIENSQPLHIIYSDDIGSNYSQSLELDSTSTLVITLIKPAKDGSGLIARIFNPTDKTSSSRLLWKRNSNARFFISNGDEDEIKQTAGKITLNTFEVMTLKIKP
ncbi:MAG: hypothetical protein HYS25_09190 [Ignavibacteriales bacterium]|nr:hypothetical protein [Ignavibacteriales bacterium]